MQEYALTGLTAEAGEDDFATGWWFEPFGLDAQAVMQLVPEALERAQLVTLKTPREKQAERPLPPGEPHGMLLAWPGAGGGLAMLVVPDGERWNLTGFWPFLTGLSEHDAEIEQVTLAPDRLQAMVTARIGGELILTYHEVLFAARRGLYVKGVDHRLVLAGVAHSFRRADAAPILIGPDAPAFAALSKGGTAVGKDGNITIQTRGMAAIFPRSDIAPHAAEFRGPVIAVRKNLTDILGQPVWLVRVTVARVGEDHWTDIHLDIAVSATVLDGRPLPAVGDDIEGFILLQGSIWMPAINRPTPDPVRPPAPAD